jgi:3-methyl-2-oxobutanoate hydroxymethyltransferase
VLVTHDILGLTGPYVPAFAKPFAALGPAITQAAQSFADEVRTGVFPAATVKA